MNQINGRAWLDALRSGHYPKGRGKLRQGLEGEPECYCVLGVATELAVAAGILPPGVRDELSGVYTYSDPPEPVVELDAVELLVQALDKLDSLEVVIPTYDGLMPRAVRQWLEIDPSFCSLRVSVDNRYLGVGGLNDTGAYSFPELADLIEAEYLSEKASPGNAPARAGKRALQPEVPIAI